LESLFEQYKELGLYEETVFVIFGDHGEGFGEHDRSMHGDTPYEEGIKVPLIIHAPGQFDEGQRVEGLASQMDILPTVVDMLGYEVENGEYPGYSLLARIPEDRTLMFSCISNRKCLASIQGYEKYIYHYNNQPDEFFDLSEDPLERKNIVNMRNKAELDRLRGALIEWRSEVNAEYSGSTSQPY
jgi:arylsulfatase A-like enzyme